MQYPQKLNLILFPYKNIYLINIKLIFIINLKKKKS